MLNQKDTSMLLDCSSFEGMIDGQRIGLYQIKSLGGMKATICNYGARVIQWIVPGHHVELQDMVVSLPNLAALKSDKAWMGAFVGRFANRIGRAQLSRGEQQWTLTANEGFNNLHSGAQGCSQQVFQVLTHQNDKLELHCTLPDGADGFPGEVGLTLTYQLDDMLGLSVTWKASVSQAPTVCSFTSHIYFNLSGKGGTSLITDHRLQIPSSRILELNSERVPTGNLVDVEGGPLDWRQLRTIGSTDFDQYWITPDVSRPLTWQAHVESKDSGFAMDVWSTEPGLQFYAGGVLGIAANKLHDQYGRLLVPGAAFCLEPSGYPDAPSHANFPNSWFEPGETCQGRIEYRLSRLGI